jgi:glycosyltransferase XagB
LAVAFGGVKAAAIRRRQVDEWADRRKPEAFVPRARERPLQTPRPGACPELDCVRKLLPRRVIAAAESRARLIGLGADRVLICADALTEEAYLTALAASLGTSYERLDRISRVDCPLDNEQLLQAAAAGLLPLREDGELVWVVAPRCLTARRLASQSWPGWLRSFRLTSSDRLWRFVARHGGNALGRRAAEGLSRSKPLLSNAPRPHGAGYIASIAFVLLALMIVAMVSAGAVEACATLLCALFLAAAALRLLSVAFGRRAPDRQIRVSDNQLPVYTIICPLYREANVVDNLVAAIDDLDYPGIMAQTPQAP